MVLEDFAKKKRIPQSVQVTNRSVFMNLVKMVVGTDNHIHAWTEKMQV
jgi:hypothetical protein